MKAPLLVGAALLAFACSALLWRNLSLGTGAEPQPTAGRSLGVGELWVPWRIYRRRDGNPIVCAGGGYGPGTHLLTGAADDPRVVWMLAGGRRYDLEFPVGYSA